MSIESTRSTLQRYGFVCADVHQELPTLSSVIRGVGEMDVYGHRSSRASVAPLTPISEQLNLEYDERPYLLVDLRDRDEYRTNHIVSGTTPHLSVRSFARLTVSF